jgi:hypothetical protein
LTCAALLRPPPLQSGVFTGKSPRQAANRGYTDIKLRERGTKKLHVFTGERVQVDKPKGAPAWMSAKIWKLQVKRWAWRSWNSSEAPLLALLKQMIW